MDQARWDAPAVEAMRHHPVHRAPIIAEQQVETAHVAREVAIARQRRAAVERRRILWEIDPYPWRDRVARAQRVGHGRQDGMMGAILHQVHQRSEEHTSELQSLMRISYAVFCLKKKNIKQK